jgi:hypothetical protein
MTFCNPAPDVFHRYDEKPMLTLSKAEEEQ